MSEEAYVELRAEGLEPVVLDGAYSGPGHLYITGDGIEGWYETPDVKVTMSERGQGDGAHDVPDDALLYSSRTVTVHYGCEGSTRREVLDLLLSVQRFAHRTVTVRVVDGGYDTFCTGYVASKVSAQWSSSLSWDDTLTIVCARPERLSWEARTFTLWAASQGRGGLSYGPDGKGLAYPIGYGAAAVDARNVGVFTNDGTSRAYPVFTIHGSFPSGVELMFQNGSLLYAQPVGAVPVTLDSRSATASLGGRDVSRNLARRGFPVVEPGASLSVSLVSPGSGYVSCSLRDTWL